MIVSMIFVRDEYESPWLEAAFDEYTLDGNPSVYDDALNDAVTKFGGDDVREITLEVDYDKVLAAFKPVDATPEGGA